MFNINTKCMIKPLIVNNNQPHTFTKKHKHTTFYILFTHQQMQCLLNLEEFKFTLEYT